MKYVSIFSVTLKSAITPSFIGFTATTFPGVRPSISLASLPTASTSPLFLLMATMDGSLTTIPLPLAYTSVLAVPRSIARSEEIRLKIDRKFMNVDKPLYDGDHTALSSINLRNAGERKTGGGARGEEDACWIPDPGWPHSHL